MASGIFQGESTENGQKAASLVTPGVPGAGDGDGFGLEPEPEPESELAWLPELVELEEPHPTVVIVNNDKVSKIKRNVFIILVWELFIFSTRGERRF